MTMESSTSRQSIHANVRAKIAFVVKCFPKRGSKVIRS